MYTLMRYILFLLLTTISYAQTSGTTIEVEIENISNENGQLLIGLYDSENNWLKKSKISAKSQIKDGKSLVTFTNVTAGTYAISLFHDENDNGELDTNFIGMPKEDTGSSNNAPSNFGPPKWEDAKFEVKGKTITQVINL